MTLLVLAAMIATVLAIILFFAGEFSVPAQGTSSSGKNIDEISFSSLTNAGQFEEQGNWSDGFRIARQTSHGVVVGPGTENRNVFAQRFVAASSMQYIVVTRAESLGKKNTTGKFQINWFDKSGNFLKTSQDVFAVTPIAQIFHFRATAPEGAAHGQLYVGPGNMVDQVRYTEMRIGIAADVEMYFPEPGVTSSPRFDSLGNWSESGFNLAKSDRQGVVVGPGNDNPNVFAQHFPVKAGDQFKVLARASSPNGDNGVAKIQINWSDATGKSIAVSQEPFVVTPAERTFLYRITAPFGAAIGTLYVVPGGAGETIRYTEMRLDRLDIKSDYAYLRILGLEIRVWALLLAAAICLFAARYVAVNLSGIYAAYAARTGQAVFFVLAISISALSFLALEIPYESQVDSRWHQAQVDAAMRWNSFSFDLGSNPLYNFGVQWPVNPLLSPTYWLGTLASVDHRIQVQGGFQSAMFFLLFVWASRMAGSKQNDASAIGLIAALLMCYPNLSDGAITLNAVLGLLWQDAAVATFFGAICFTLIGDQRLSARLRHAPAIGLFLSVIWLWLAYPELVPFYVFALAGLCIGAVLASEGRFELLQKAAVSLAIVVCVLGIGFHKYILALFNYTPQMYFGALINESLWFWLFANNTSILTHFGLTGWKLTGIFLFAILGAVIAIRKGNPIARKFAVIALTFEATLYAFSGANAYFHGFVISFFYVELMGIAIIVLLAATAFWGILCRLADISLSIGLSKYRNAIQFVPHVGLVTIIVSGVYGDYKNTNQIVIGYPPNVGHSFVSGIVDRVKSSPGELFHGRVATIAGTSHVGPAGWGEFASVVNGKFRPKFGNDLFIDLATSDVPLVNEYGHWTSPAMLAFQCAALCRPEDFIAKAAHAARAFNPALARLMGVSVVVSDMALSSEQEPFGNASLEAGNETKVLAYQLDDANLGQYSPTNTIFVQSASEIFEHLQSRSFDGRNTALVEKPISVKLSPIRSSMVRVQKGPILEVEAVSDSISLVVLPFEFSHCMDVSGEGLVEKIPVNLAQVGLLVAGHAKLRLIYRFGPWSGAECRKMDLDRIKRLKLKQGSVGKIFQAHD